MKIKAAVEKIEKQRALLIAGEDQYELSVPLKFLPEDIGEGDFLNVTFNREGRNIRSRI